MDQPRLTEQVALVTGGGRGIGRGIAIALAHEGAHVCVCSRTDAEIRSAVEEIQKLGGTASALVADVSSETDVQALAKSVIERYGRMDILVNNAGIGIMKPVTELSVEEFDNMWKVNTRGVFMVTKAFLPSMIAAKRGIIVNIASLAAKNTFKNGAGYCASKWALRGIAGSLMLEVREYNIRVVTIFPGSVDTGFSPHGKKGDTIPQPEDIGAAVVFAATAPSRAMISEIDVRPTRV